jgi:hypothetical protein
MLHGAIEDKYWFLQFSVIGIWILNGHLNMNNAEYGGEEDGYSLDGGVSVSHIRACMKRFAYCTVASYCAVFSVVFIFFSTTVCIEIRL